ncbi:retrovirus-related Pol polyprotein from transposon opus [Trichonephila clavata]|uniref:RNA-directed DNA polymerase n=1 Tax=Trichonephila clavata TaxID=2740835 RepID=A0A8X6JKH3_TRICU|nr:retrovirus-related Pol polyprotein from transposon opus [Trichonephila clavata]
MEDVIKRTAGKRYNYKMDIKSAFNTIRIRETDIYETGFVTPDGHFEFLCMPFGVTNGPSTMTRAIKLAYNHLALYNEKRNFALSEISLFGRILSQEGESSDPERTSSVNCYSTLKSIQEVRSFLGFANQFRKYIRNYAVIAKPLTNSLKGLEKKASNAVIILTDGQQRSFETLKTKITSSPILAYFKQGLPTFVETDASYSGLGAILSRDQNGKRRVIEYASRSLKDTETRYHSNELECTAVHWALTEKFRLYLLGHKFELITDNYTTAYVVSKSAINRKFARYLVDLAQFDFSTVHRPGKQNVIADHLSRFPTPPVCLTVTASHESEIYTKQLRDDFCQYIFRLLKEKKPNKKTMSIIRDNNTLVRLQTNGLKSLVVIPKAMSQQTLLASHDDVGHMDAKKTLYKLQQRYWWPKMRKDCKTYARSCHKCQIVNHRTANAYGLLQQLPIPTTPWEIVSSGHVICLPLTKAGNTNMFVQIDHATRYVIATPSASLAASTVTDALYHNNIFQYGPPRDLVLYDWPKQGDHKISPIFKGPFVIVRPVGAVCYEIKSTTPGNKVLKVVHVQHLRPYFKRESPTIEEDDSSDEESESTAEMKDPADDLQGVPNVTEL